MLARILDDCHISSIKQGASNNKSFQHLFAMMHNQDPRDRQATEYLPERLRNPNNITVFEDGQIALTRNLEPFIVQGFNNLNRACDFARERLADEERSKLDTLELRRNERQQFYEELRRNRRQNPLRNGPVRRGPLARRVPKVPYRDRMRASKQRLNQRCLAIPKANAHRLAKSARCSHWSARKACFDILFIGEVCQYETPQHHNPNEVAELDRSINTRANYYHSSTDYKRLHPQFSKKFIRKRLKETGKRYYKKPATTYAVQPTNNQQTLTIFATILRSFHAAVGSLLWFDESVFQLRPTSDAAWDHPEFRNRPPRNRTDVSTLYLLAICNKEGMVAFKIQTRSHTSNDVKHFLAEVLENAILPRHLTILLDNHQTHIAASDGNYLRRYLTFNLPRMPQYNFIELVFSKIKSLWSRRPISPTLRDDCQALRTSIVHASNADDFAGYRRQYLRAIIEGCTTATGHRDNRDRVMQERNFDDEIFLEDD